MDRYGDATDPALREPVATALVNKAWLWRRMMTGPGRGRRGRGASPTTPNQGEDAAAAAFGLATLAALDADLPTALRLLDIAANAGAATALVCARALSGDSGARARGVEELEDLQSSDTDAANFLGITAWASGEKTRAHDAWAQSTQRGDTVAPLLLHHTTED